MVGVTWRSGVPNDAAVEVRWRSDGQWSRWTELHLDLENTWTEGGRPGTEPQWVDHADAVAVRVVAEEPSTPRDLRVATVDPGKFAATTPVAATVESAADHLAQQLGCQERRRVRLPALRIDDPWRRHPPHGRLELLLQERLRVDRAGHAGVPHERPRLVRHRLQLPGRQVRPDLRGPRRRHRQAGPRCSRRQRPRQRGDDGRLADGNVHEHRRDGRHEVRDGRPRGLALLRLRRPGQGHLLAGWQDAQPHRRPPQRRVHRVPGREGLRLAVGQRRTAGPGRGPPRRRRRWRQQHTARHTDRPALDQPDLVLADVRVERRSPTRRTTGSRCRPRRRCRTRSR